MRGGAGPRRQGVRRVFCARRTDRIDARRHRGADRQGAHSRTTFSSLRHRPAAAAPRGLAVPTRRDVMTDATADIACCSIGRSAPSRRRRRMIRDRACAVGADPPVGVDVAASAGIPRHGRIGARVATPGARLRHEDPLSIANRLSPSSKPVCQSTRRPAALLGEGCRSPHPLDPRAADPQTRHCIDDARGCADAARWGHRREHRPGRKSSRTRISSPPSRSRPPGSAALDRLRRRAELHPDYPTMPNTSCGSSRSDHASRRGGHGHPRPGTTRRVFRAGTGNGSPFPSGGWPTDGDRVA